MSGTSVPPGSQVVVSSAGLGLQELGSPDDEGAVEIVVPLPHQNVLSGSYDLDIAVNGELADTLTFSLWDPTVEFETMLFGLGNSMVASGEGFAPNSTISVYNESQFATSWQTDSQGAFTGEDIPLGFDIVPGNYNLDFVMGPNGPRHSESFNVLPAPEFTLNDRPIGEESARDLAPDESFIVAGHGLYANSPIRVWLVAADNSIVQDENFDTTQQGSFAQEVHIPAGATGEYRLQIQFNEDLFVRPVRFYVIDVS